jgi:hypothetical protein
MLKAAFRLATLVSRVVDRSGIKTIFDPGGIADATRLYLRSRRGGLDTVFRGIGLFLQICFMTLAHGAGSGIPPGCTNLLNEPSPVVSSRCSSTTG